MAIDPRTLTPEQLHERRKSTRPEMIIRPKNTDGVVYVGRTPGGKLYGRAYCGKALRPSWHYTFTDMARLQKHATAWADTLRRIAKDRADRSAARAAFRHTLQVGDILVSTWGYDQTNVDYYQITQLNGQHMVTACAIGADNVDRGNMTGRSVPVPGKFTGKPFRARVGSGNSIKGERCGYASPLQYTTVAGARIYQSTAWTAYA